MDFLDQSFLTGLPTAKRENIAFAPLGEPVTATEIRARLSESLYEQLSEGKDETVMQAVNRAMIYIGAVLRRFDEPYNLDDKIVRELVLIHTIYELHIALGHEEAGREYRMKARDIILARYGSYPDADKENDTGLPWGAIRVPNETRGF